MSRFISKVVYILLCLLVIASAVRLFGPTVETYVYPVYSRFEIVSIAATKDGKTKAVFRFTKHRPCVPHGFTWYSGEAGAAYDEIGVAINQDMAVPAVRPIGEQLTSEYVLDVEPSVLERGVYAEIYSRCHPFWITTSIVYP